MRPRPVAASEVEAAAQQQLAQPMPTSLQIFTGIIPRARQVANRLVFKGRRLDRRQQSRASQLRQLARIAAIRFHPLPGFPWNQRRRDHLAAHTRGRHLPLQRVPTWSGFIEHTHRPRRGALELPHQALHRLRLVRRRPAHRRGPRAHEHREKEVLLVRINSDVRSNLIHDRLLSMRLWRREASTRDFGGSHHLVECDSTTTLR